MLAQELMEQVNIARKFIIVERIHAADFINLGLKRA